MFLGHSSTKSHPSSKSCFSLEKSLSTEQARIGSFGSSDVSPVSAARLDAMLLMDEPDEAKMQLVWLEETDLLNGTRSSNLSFSSLTS